MATRTEVVRVNIDEIVQELNLLDNEAELNPQQERHLASLRPRETALRAEFVAELVAEIAAQGNSK